MDKKKESLTKNVGKVSTGTFLSRITGLLRDITITHFLGATWVADSFGVAFVIPNMLRGLFGEGALSAAFIPIYTELKEKKTKKETIQFALNILSLVVIVLVALVLVGILLTPIIVHIIAPGFEAEARDLTISLTRILFPYLLLIGLTSTIIAILNAHSIFFLPSFSPTLFNLGIILPVVIHSIIFESTLEQKVYIFAAGVLIGGLCQLLMNLPLLKKIGYRLKFYVNLKQKEISLVWKRMVPGIIGLGVREVNVVVDTLLASFLVTGSVAALQYGNRLMQLPLGVFGIAVATAALPLFSRQTASNKTDELKASVQDALNLILLIMIPITVLIIVIGKDAIALIYLHGRFDQRALMMTYSALVFYAFGLVSHSCVRIFAPTFFALKDTKTPVKIAAIAAICNILLDLILIKFLKLRGLALATSLAATIQAIFLYVLINQRIGRLDFKTLCINAVKILTISCIIGSVAYFLSQIAIPWHLNERLLLLIRLVIIICISALLYLGGLRLFNVKSAKLLRL
jgi:putative peptidoglycan lipid II flippase